MSEIVAFLRARLDEDEAAARQFDDYDPTRPTKLQKALNIKPSEPAAWELEPSPEYITVYIDPARVLAEVDAKRRIMDEYARLDANSPPDVHVAMAIVLEHLVSVYRPHPDFRAEWLGEEEDA